MEENLLNIVKEYKSVIAKFKNKSGVLSGFDIAWKGNSDVALLSNTPYSIGDGLGTTGWCVSASEALLNDNIFQLSLRFRSAKAKLISIDIKEQYYGYCYNGSQNKWHTAILVEDSGYSFIIDITCRQFGNSFVEKDIWELNTWIETLRHSMCNHKLTDFLDNPLISAPVINKDNRNIDLINIVTIDKLRQFTNLSDSDRVLLSEFYNNHKIIGKDELNRKLMLGTLSTKDFSNITKLIKILQVMPFVSLDAGYSILEFESKSAAKNWVKIFLESGYVLPIFMTVSGSINSSCIENNIDPLDFNREYVMGNENNPTYIVLEFNKVFGVKTPSNNSEILLSSGIQLVINNPAENIFNGGKLFNPNKLTNTIFIKID